MRRGAVLALPFALLLLAGCAAEADEVSSDTSASPAPSASVGPTTGPNPDAPEDDATVDPVPEAGQDSRESAIEAAVDAVEAFGRPDLAYQDWIDGLYPYMTQAGASAYENTDPANVPVHEVTGDGVILEGSTEVALIVQVPTDAGLYNVSLSRTGADAPWLADRIRPAGA